MNFSTTQVSRFLTVSVAAVAVSFDTGEKAIAQILNGAGASFPAPLYQQLSFTQRFC